MTTRPRKPKQTQQPHKHTQQPKETTEDKATLSTKSTEVVVRTGEATSKKKGKHQPDPTIVDDAVEPVEPVKTDRTDRTAECDPAIEKELLYYELIVIAQVAIIDGWEETSRPVTRAYWALDKALTAIRIRHLWPQKTPWRKWCTKHRLNDSRRSRAKDIGHYFTEKEAAKLTLPDALQKIKEKKHKENAARASSILPPKQFSRKLKSVDAGIIALAKLAVSLTDEELVTFKDGVVDALTPLEQLRDLIEAKMAKRKPKKTA